MTDEEWEWQMRFPDGECDCGKPILPFGECEDRCFTNKRLTSTMKIISQPQIRVPLSYPIRSTCGVCKTLFEFDEADVTAESSQLGENLVTVSCPTCEVVETVPKYKFVPNPDLPEEDCVGEPHLSEEYSDEVIQKKIDADSNYPLGEHDAMKWAIAWRLIRTKNDIDANGDTDGWMVGWFANAMGYQQVLDNLQSLVDEPSASDEKITDIGEETDWVNLNDLNEGDIVTTVGVEGIPDATDWPVDIDGMGQLYIATVGESHFLRDFTNKQTGEVIGVKRTTPSKLTSLEILAGTTKPIVVGITSIISGDVAKLVGVLAQVNESYHIEAGGEIIPLDTKPDNLYPGDVVALVYRN